MGQHSPQAGSASSVGCLHTSGRLVEVKVHHALLSEKTLKKMPVIYKPLGKAQGSSLSLWPYHVVALGSNCLGSNPRLSAE